MVCLSNFTWSILEYLNPHVNKFDTIIDELIQQDVIVNKKTSSDYDSFPPCNGNLVQSSTTPEKDIKDIDPLSSNPFDTNSTHYVKSVEIRSFFLSVFPCIRT